MKIYRYTPFNLLSIAFGFVSLFYLLITLYDIGKINSSLKILFSLTFLNPLFPILLWIVDYYLQKKRFKYYLIIEIFISIAIVGYFFYGLVNF